LGRISAPIPVLPKPSVQSDSPRAHCEPPDTQTVTMRHAGTCFERGCLSFSLYYGREVLGGHLHLHFHLTHRFPLRALPMCRRLPQEKTARSSGPGSTLGSLSLSLSLSLSHTHTHTHTHTLTHSSLSRRQFKACHQTRFTFRIPHVFLFLRRLRTLPPLRALHSEDASRSPSTPSTQQSR